MSEAATLSWQPAQDRHRGDAEDRDRDEELDQGLAAVVAPRCSDGRTCHTSTWLKMPYIAETRATATKPTIRPMTMMTAGSKSAVSFLIL